jgi:hypothetical protein
MAATISKSGAGPARLPATFAVLAWCFASVAAKDGLEDVMLSMATEEWSSAFMDLIVGFAATAFTGISALLVYYLTQDRPLDAKEKANQTYDKMKMELRRDPVLTFQWCQANGLVADVCPFCKKELDVGDSTKGGSQIKCMSCKQPVPALQGTWFENIDIDPWKAICVMYHWGVGNSHRSAATQLALDEDTIRHWYKKCQEASEFNLKLCSNAKSDEEEDIIHYKKPLGRDHYENDHVACYCPKYKIGGKGRIVEVDILERGDLLHEKYVLAAIERGGWRAFAVPVPDRGSKTVKALIKAKVFPGTIIRGSLDGEDPIALSEIKHVRALLRDLSEKMKQPATEDMIPVYVAQWMWRRVNEATQGDVFTTMVDHVANAYPFNPDGPGQRRRTAVSFCRPDDEDEEEPEEVCTQMILLPNKPPVINKFLLDKAPAQSEVAKKPAAKKEPPSKFGQRSRSSRRPPKQRSYIRIAPRPMIVRAPPPGVPVPRRAY